MFVPFQNHNKKYSPERRLMSSFVQKKKKLKKLNIQTKDIWVKNGTKSVIYYYQVAYS